MKLRRSVAHYPDTEAEGVPEEVRDGCRVSGARSIVYAPLVLEEKGIGSLWVARAQAGPFADKQIALLKTFADQAVIAIQNVRLFNETKEALEQQTATAEILQVISSSRTDIQPVFDSIAYRASQLSGGLFANVFRFDGELIHLVATSNSKPGVRRAAAQPVSDAARWVADRGPGRSQQIGRGPDRCTRRTPTTRMRWPSPAAGGACSACRCCATTACSGRSWSVGRNPGRSEEARRPAQDLRRPGRHRDRERAAVQPDQGGARAADRDRRGAAGHQQLADRHAAGVRQDPRRAATRAVRRATSCGSSWSMARARVDLVRGRGRDPERTSALRRIFPVPLARSAARSQADPRAPCWCSFTDVDGPPSVPRRCDRRARSSGLPLAALCVPMLRDGQRDRRDRWSVARSRGAFAETEDRPAADLRRPGRDRDRERAALQRDQERCKQTHRRSARLPDRHRRRAAAASASRPPMWRRCSKTFSTSATRLFGQPIGAAVPLRRRRRWTSWRRATGPRRGRCESPFPRSAQSADRSSGRVLLSGTVQVEEDTFLDPDYDQATAPCRRLAAHDRRAAAA